MRAKNGGSPLSSEKFRPFVNAFGRLVKQPFTPPAWMGYLLSMTMKEARDFVFRDPRR